MDMSINSAMDLYNSYNKTDITSDKLKDSLSKDYSNSTEEELMGVCKEFEAYFLEQIFKGMEKMVPEHEYESSSTKSMMEYYKDSLMSEYASSASNSGEGIGLAQMLFEQMKRNYDL